VPLVGCGGADGGGRGRGRVVVVGAGLAGLTAAYELGRKGWDVTVFEARDRVGGRCRTFRRELRYGQVAEAGGEFIDASHDAVRGYAEAFGLELDDLRAAEGDDALSAAVYTDGELEEYDDVVDEDVQSELDRLDEEVERYTAAIDVADPVRTGAGLDSRSVGDLLDDLVLDADARAIAEAGLRAEYAVEPSELSLLFHVVLTAIAPDRDEDVERFRIRGGNDRLPGAFAERLRDSVVLEAPVASVQSRRSRVRVVAGRDEVDADYCVVAAPLPGLRHVELDADLPRVVRDAIASLQYGDVTKTALQYESRFWRDAGYNGDALTDLPIQATRDATGSQSGEAGVLMSYSASEQGTRFGAGDPRARVRNAAAQVAEVYSDSEAEELFARGATIAWGRERFTGGSYSAWAPGQYTRFWPALRRPYGRVYFAGEHTDLHASYMEGAVRSGRRVANDIDARGA